MIQKNQVKLMAMGMLILTVMTGCAPNKNNANERQDTIQSMESENMAINAEEQKSQADTVEQDVENEQPQTTEMTETTGTTEAIENELARYRAEREKLEWNKGRYVIKGSPNDDDYKYGIGENNYIGSFDTRELELAYKTARVYVEETLQLESDVEACVDPRMNAIFEDEDKGVAKGYDADNIFLCEYNDNGKWQYLILAREKKGSDWKVLYHGSSYKTEESDGGEKNEKTNMDGIPETVE